MSTLLPLMPIPKMQFFSNSGLPLNGGYLYTYVGGQPSVPKATYSDYDGQTLNANPIILDSSGRATIFLADTGTYCMQLWTGEKSLGTSTMVWSIDGVSPSHGDMLQSVYDTNGDGIVNEADIVPWAGVTDTPTTLAGYGITDAMALVAPGTTGNILTSDGSKWTSASYSSSGMTNPMTTAGDIIYGTTAGAPARLAKGTDGNVLTQASGIPSWASPTVPAHTLDSHSNVTITANSDGEILRWNGSAWVNNTLAEASVTTLTTAQTITGAKTFDGGIIITDEVRETPTVANTSTAYTVNITSGTLFDLTLTGNCTFTFPADQAGRQFTIILKQDGTGSRTVTWPTDVRWAGGTTPTVTATASRTDVFSFVNDGTYWLGFTGGQNYTRA